MNRTLSITLLALLGASIGLSAQTTLDECRSLARENYPAIRRYSLIEQTKEYSLSNAAKAWLPQFAIGAQASWQSAVATFPEQFTSILESYGADFPGIRKDQYQLSLQAEQTIWDGGMIRAEKALASAQAKEQSSSLDVDLYELEKRVDDIYFGILMLDRRIEQTEATMALLEDNLRTVRSMVKGGVATGSDSDALEAEVLTAGQSLSQLLSARESYRNMLELFIGKELGSDALQTPSAPRLSEQAIRPELRAIDAGMEVLNAREATINASILPRFSLYAQGWYGYPGLDMFKSMTSPDWSWNAIVGVRMTWNVSALYTRENNLKSIRTAKAMSEVQKDIFIFNTRLQNIGSSREISRLESLGEDDEKILRLRRDIRMSAESRFRNGVINATELLKAITDEENAESSLHAHRLELIKTEYELKHNNL